MIFWVALVLTALALGAWRWRNGKEEPGVGLVRLTLAAVLTWVGFIVVLAACHDNTTDHFEERRELLTLRDGKQRHSDFGGAFVLAVGMASGSSDIEWKYTWYDRAETGAVQLHTATATNSDIVIYEDSPREPYVLYRSSREANDYPDWAAPFDGFTEEWESDGTELHVPPGTVERSLQLDAE